MSQIFRFCIRCCRMSLIQDGECFFCKGKFVLSGLKDDSKIRKPKNEKTH